MTKIKCADYAIALGTAVLFAGQFIVPGVLVPVLEVASGVVVL